MYKSQTRVKAPLARKRIEKMEKGREEARKSNAKGHDYESGMAVSSEGQNGPKTSGQKRNCPHCGGDDHKTKRSKRCKRYAPNMKKDDSVPNCDFGKELSREKIRLPG